MHVQPQFILTRRLAAITQEPYRTVLRGVFVSSQSSPSVEFSPRQSAVLAEALRLLVEGGDKALTTAGLARAASCSKESLYKWFGDRDGLLAAMISFQQSKVRTVERSGERLTADLLR